MSLANVQMSEITLTPDLEHHSSRIDVQRKAESGDCKTSNDLIRTSAFRSLTSAEPTEFKFFLRTVLIHLADLPPLTTLYDSDTLDRIGHWFVVKKHAELLYYSFKSYFQGTGNPHENIPADVKYLIDLQRDIYKSLYDLIHDGWIHIKTASQKLDNFGLFETPGKVFLQIITDEILFQLNLAYPEDKSSGGNGQSSFLPRQYSKKEAEIEKLRRLKANGVLSKLEAAKLHRLEVQQSKLTKDQGRVLRYFCVNACSKAGKKTTTHRKYVEYLRLEAELDTHLRKVSRKARGFAWEKGTLRRGCQEGGTYR